MPRFEGPSPPYPWSLLCEWRRNVGPEMQDPELLWGDYWERFNTVKIPILEEYAYFDTALEIAKLSKNKEEFEQRFEERNTKHKEEVLKFMSKTWTEAMFDPEVSQRGCPDALVKVKYACSTGCLQDFLQVLKGVVYGWEAEEVHDAQEHSDDGPSSCNNCGSTQLLSCLQCKSKVEFCGDCRHQPKGCPKCLTQYADINPSYQCVDLQALEEQIEYLGRMTRGVEEVDNEQEHSDDGPSSCNNCESTQLLTCKHCKLKVDFCDDCGQQPDHCPNCLAQHADIDPSYQPLMEPRGDLEQTVRDIVFGRYTTPRSNGINTNILLTTLGKIRVGMQEYERACMEEEERQSLQRISRKRDASIQQAADSTTDSATSNLIEEPQTFYQRDMRSPDYGDFVDAVEYQESACTTPISSSIQTTPRKRKRVRFSDVDNVYNYQQESQSTTSSFASIQQATIDKTWIPENHDYGRVRKRQKVKSSSTLESKPVNSFSPLAADQSASRKRSRCNDDDDDGRVLKRQKPKSSSSLKSTSTSSSSPLAAGQSASRKRSRCNNDNDTGNHTQERQKPETPAVYTPIPRASSPIHQGAKISEKRKKSPQVPETSHSPRPVNTRSLGRQG